MRHFRHSPSLAARVDCRVVTVHEDAKTMEADDDAGAVAEIALS
jgi:hypothetical protein